MKLLDFPLGKPLPTGAQGDEKIGVFAGVSIFGLDALGSAALGIYILKHTQVYVSEGH